MSLFVGLDLFPLGCVIFLLVMESFVVAASGAGAQVSKPGELHMAVVLSKQPLEMSQADILLARGL
ncbi:hypothetical protein DB44_GX00010 [Candidatus Protochlamydia amoebophila]|uniref:Uncharacterized protein n=1 Tax=Candidatus Protochlamydia amoebophila TaxID=362787 RepID=A0A0C1JJB6_9BACT|nr:hypothetical protein DB44_GX00010 [Candidatus Protochlamydia amoebophila]